MPTKFRLGLIGAGLITQGAHLPAALASASVTITALVDPIVDRAKALAEAYGLQALVCASASEIVGKVDGVVIATPNHTHRQIAVECLDAGIHTLVEKPLAGSVAEGEAILAAARKAGATLAVGYSTRFRSNTQLLKDLIAGNHFGRTRRFAHQFGTAGGWAPLSGYNLRSETSGGGVLVVSGSHFLDRMLYLWGFPDEARLEDDSLGGPEANCVARVGYNREDGPIGGVARYSKTSRLIAGLVVETEGGLLTLEDSDDASILFQPSDKAHLTYAVKKTGCTVSQVDCFRLQIEDFVDACIQKRPAMVDGTQALESLRLIELLYRNRTCASQAWYRDEAREYERGVARCA